LINRHEGVFDFCTRPTPGLKTHNARPKNVSSK